MITRTQQREFAASLSSLSGILSRIAWEDEERRGEVADCLSLADAFCQEHFSASRASFYHEVFFGLRSILCQTDWQQLTHEDQDEARRLMMEILQGGIASLRAERDVRKLIVFLPYKAAMWDSLESIWRAVFLGRDAL